MRHCEEFTVVKIKVWYLFC